MHRLKLPCKDTSAMNNVKVSKSLKVDKLKCEKINDEMLVNPIENS